METINFTIKGVFKHIKDLGNLDLTVYEMLETVNFLNEKSNSEIYKKLSDLMFGLRVVFGDYVVECRELTSDDKMILNDYMGDLIDNAIIGFKDYLINVGNVYIAFENNLKDFDYAIVRLFNDLLSVSNIEVNDSINNYINDDYDRYNIYYDDTWDLLKENFNPWDLINGKVTHEDVYDAWYNAYINDIENLKSIIIEAVDVNELIDFIEWYY